MKLEIQDAKGLTGFFIEVPLEQLKEGMGLLSSSPETEVQLKESQGKVEELEKQVAELEGKKPIVDQVAKWVDPYVIAELVVDHLKSTGRAVTFEEAKSVWLETLEMLGSHLAELKEKLATAEVKTMSDFTPIEKADFVIAWAKELSMEDKAIFCEGVGIPIAKVTEAEVAEAAAKAAVEAEPSVIVGKTDRPGFKYLEYLNMSVKE